MKEYLKGYYKKQMNYDVQIVEGHIVRITGTDENNNEYIWNIYLENIFWGGRIVFPMPVPNNQKDKIIWMHDLSDDEFKQTGEYAAKGNSTGVICVYTNKKTNEMYFIMFTNRQQMYKRFVHFKHKDEQISFDNNQLNISFKGSLYSDKYDYFKVKNMTLVVDDNNAVELEQYFSKEKEFKEYKSKISLDSIVSQETAINNQILIKLSVNGEEFTYHIGKKVNKKYPKKYNFLPVASTYYSDKALAVRGNLKGHYSLVVRDMEPMEYDVNFKFYENPKRSKKMYWVGKLKRLFRRKKINLYYEKNSMKAEEGTFEVFEASLNSKKSENYFILDKTSPQWEVLSKHRNVVERYSDFYYELVYTANCCISTEMSSHLNVLRSNNIYLRRALMDMDFIFLQHGVTYLKRQGNTSAFTKGKDGEPTYIVVDSEKEAQVVSEMLKIEKERCIIAGLPIFSTIEYEHINENSEDIVTIMLTWKPSEEHLISHFEDSSYYQNTIQIYELLSKRIDSQNIRIVSHPKVIDLLINTSLKDSIWQGSISDVLSETKLLITDYSSVCYNAFYQGAGVIFYQPDLEKYENEVGKLIPTDDEYIGYRCFDVHELECVLDKTVCDNMVNVSFFKNSVFKNRYFKINEFSDGMNVNRIVMFLSEICII